MFNLENHLSSLSKEHSYSRRGESNSARKGLNKVHRRVTPCIDNVKVPLRANRLTSVIRKHNFNANYDFIKIRHRHDMRVSIRSERRESMLAACFVCTAFTDFHPDREDGIFEVRKSIEELARVSGMLTVYDSGRKAYDCFLKALETISEAGGMIIRKAKDPETKQWKPHRIFLTPKFFEWFGMGIDKLRRFVLEHKRWLIKNGLEKSDKEKYESHLMKMAQFKIKDAEKSSHYSLRKLLKKIQRYVVGDERKNETINDIKAQIKLLEEEKRLQRAKTKEDKHKTLYSMYNEWRASHSSEEEIKVAMEVRSKHLYVSMHSDEYYQLFLQHVGVIPILQ